MVVNKFKQFKINTIFVFFLINRTKTSWVILDFFPTFNLVSFCFLFFFFSFCFCFFGFFCFFFFVFLFLFFGLSYFVWHKQIASSTTNSHYYRQITALQTHHIIAKKSHHYTSHITRSSLHIFTKKSHDNLKENFFSMK